ncbi:FAD-dependent oxidoreductase [Pseudomonadales bacterium]|nr:FAD-dependent oxidoreductase [Pseudomonadales bacterium]MDC0892945.1 FAD-dependent oxidoreductase [Pseudomonadales bacterium]
MSKVGSESNPLRVAIIGSGPAGFYTVSNFLKQTDLTVEMDMFERLPTPFGLVRAGVAPDHQKYKTVTRAYDKSAQHSSFRFFGNVEYGTDITLEDLKDHYHQIMFATGAPSDRNLGIPGEELTGSHSATDFVAWYNGHPDCTDFKFDLSQESVAVIGLGNVAIDVARILCKTDAELASTDMADYALDALRASNVKNVYVLGRRGPAQAAFTPPEIKEMGELEDADVFVPVDEATLDSASQAELDASGDKNVKKNVAVIEEFSQRTERDNSRHLTIRFLVSPTELIGENGAVSAIKIVKNEAYADENGGVKARATDQEEIIPVGMVFRSVGYRGAPVAEVPFDDYNGTIQNTEGRITDDDKNPLTGMYVAGWIKRGPTGVIGTNKTDAQETVNHMAEDARAGAVFEPTKSAEHVVSLLSGRKPDVITYSDWNKIDEHELSNGAASDRPRVKLTNIEDMLAVLN